MKDAFAKLDNVVFAFLGFIFVTGVILLLALPYTWNYQVDQKAEMIGSDSYFFEYKFDHVGRRGVLRDGEINIHTYLLFTLALAYLLFIGKVPYLKGFVNIITKGKWHDEFNPSKLEPLEGSVARLIILIPTLFFFYLFVKEIPEFIEAFEFIAGR